MTKYKQLKDKALKELEQEKEDSALGLLKERYRELEIAKATVRKLEEQIANLEDSEISDEDLDD